MACDAVPSLPTPRSKDQSLASEIVEDLDPGNGDQWLAECVGLIGPRTLALGAEEPFRIDPDQGPNAHAFGQLEMPDAVARS